MNVCGDKAGAAGKPKIAGIILAAGQSRRMGPANKLLSKLKGKSLIRHVTGNAIAAGLAQVIVVTGYEAGRIRQDLSGLNIIYVHNQNFAEGLSSSLKTGIQTLGPRIDAALILLGDMPFINADIIKTIAATWARDREEHILVPHCRGQRGNPVLWPRRYFDELASLSSDSGARQLFHVHRDAIMKIELGEGILQDIDTPEAAAAIGAELNAGPSTGKSSQGSA